MCLNKLWIGAIFLVFFYWLVFFSIVVVFTWKYRSKARTCKKRNVNKIVLYCIEMCVFWVTSFHSLILSLSLSQPVHHLCMTFVIVSYKYIQMGRFPIIFCMSMQSKNLSSMSVQDRERETKVQIESESFMNTLCIQYIKKNRSFKSNHDIIENGWTVWKIWLDKMKNVEHNKKDVVVVAAALLRFIFWLWSLI